MSNRSYIRAVHPVLFVRSGNGEIAQALCECGQHSDWRIVGRNPPPEIVRKHFTRQGWAIGKRCICPACQVTIPKPRSQPMPSTTTKTEPHQPSDLARKAKQLVFLALIDYYDERAKAYKPGHSDKTIASECGCAEKFVKEVREADFGPLAEPDEIAEIRDQLRVATASLGALQARLEMLCTRNGWAG